jgi:hypothetical protein
LSVVGCARRRQKVVSPYRGHSKMPIQFNLLRRSHRQVAVNRMTVGRTGMRAHEIRTQTGGA